MNKALFDYIKNSPSPFHAVAYTVKLLESDGFTRLDESKPWEMEAGKGYYVTRNGSSVIAFRAPQKDFVGFMMTASHCDSPTFKIKENAELSDPNFVRLSVERYGGSSPFAFNLSIRVFSKESALHISGQTIGVSASPSVL